MFVASSSAAEPCEEKADQRISLSGEKPDIISVHVYGPNCEQAKLSIRIVSASGTTLYERTIPFTRFHAHSGSPPYAEPPTSESAKRIVQRIVSSREHRKVEDLLPHFSRERDDGIKFETFLITEATAERLRQQPIFTLATGWETWAELAYDPKESRGIAIAEGWR